MAEAPAASAEGPKYVVTIFEAKDIVKMDMIGHCDPYFILRYGNEEAKTSIKENCSAAVWNETFEFQVTQPEYEDEEEPQELEIFGYDKDMLNSEFFGKATVPLNKQPFDGWVEFWNHNKPGEKAADLKIRVKFIDPNATAQVIQDKMGKHWEGVVRVTSRLFRPG
mmetsp:Transcript_14405/g.18873  ORF Transcript_14405/g.18873 Transcript_14405/m.18873 type:complete len:166 (+) Transcript_14405:142-639(+)|eukprot:CAMPEP_0117758366 /NCGR_PEP_ID=MMETSP0947-20121206/15333_1 /TAXON_ID=44440 /ORGANISM="Chattonella subsalsa, Strain CCMP2191" /LENGTH=165 /DNA_ID=CAMNT_0005578535 /DNA_START=61 /DNA_END=558 /DNA_ORIENTATION=+